VTPAALAALLGILYIAAVVGLAAVLVGRGLGTRQLWLGWLILWIVTTVLVFLAASGEGAPVDFVAVLLTTATIVGIPTAVAARYAAHRATGAYDRPWWLDAIWAGVMFLVTLPFALFIAIAVGWIRLQPGL
jgi:hypothetical protein